MALANSEARKRREERGEKSLRCEAKIRPFPHDLELTCERDEEEHKKVPHRTTLRDYAYPGSETIIHWWEDDRRNFRGKWLHCESATCVLPRGHLGAHTQ